MTLDELRTIHESLRNSFRDPAKQPAISSHCETVRYENNEFKLSLQAHSHEKGRVEQLLPQAHHDRTTPAAKALVFATSSTQRSTSFYLPILSSSTNS